MIDVEELAEQARQWATAIAVLSGSDEGERDGDNSELSDMDDDEVEREGFIERLETETDGEC